MSQSKFSGTRKFTLRYQLLEINFDVDISRLYCVVKPVKKEPIFWTDSTVVAFVLLMQFCTSPVWVDLL